MGHQDKIDLTKILEPSWLKEVAPNSMLNVKDLADALKVKENTLRHKISRGEFPPPDTGHIVGHSFGHSVTYTNKSLWKISTVRKFFKQSKEKHND
jgi:hypothetical protein